jgi:hypothetical protein
MNWVSSVHKLTHRPGGRGLIPVIVWSFSLNVHAGSGVHSGSCSVGTTSSFCVPLVDGNAKLNSPPPHLVRSLSKPWMHKGIGGMAPAILNFGTSCKWEISSTARPLCYGEGYPDVPERVWVFWKREETLPFPWIEPRFLEHAASGLVTVLTELSRLHSPSVTKVTISSDVVAYGREIFCLKGYLCKNIQVGQK